MELRVEIVGGEDGSEFVRLLRRIADRIEAGVRCASVLDINGNRVGHFYLGR